MRLLEAQILLPNPYGLRGWQHHRSISAYREEAPKCGERATVQGRQRFPSCRRGPPVRRVGGDCIHVREVTAHVADIGDERRPAQPIVIKHASGPPHHLVLEVGGKHVHPQACRLDRDSAGTAKRIEDPPATGAAGEVHERSRELRMEGDRHREGPARDLACLHRRTFDLEQGLPKKEGPAIAKEPELSVRMLQINASLSVHDISHPALEISLFLRGKARMSPDPEPFGREADPSGSPEDRRQWTNREHAVHVPRQRDPLEGPPWRAGRIDDEQVRSNGDGSDDDLLRLKGREGIRPGQGRVFTGELERDAHGRPSWAVRISSLRDRHFEAGIRSARAVLALRPFAPNDIPAVAAIVRESLRENYPATIYVDIHKWWRDGFIVAEQDARIIGFIAGVSNAPQNARIH